jgi:hypothetical protein
MRVINTSKLWPFCVSHTCSHEKSLEYIMLEGTQGCMDKVCLILFYGTLLDLTIKGPQILEDMVHMVLP